MKKRGKRKKARGKWKKVKTRSKTRLNAKIRIKSKGKAQGKKSPLRRGRGRARKKPGVRFSKPPAGPRPAFNKLFIEDLDVAGKRVLARVDFNVPLKNGEVENDKRLTATLPTINYLREKGAKVILMSHLGRPDGQVRDDMRMGPVARKLSTLLGVTVRTSGDCVGGEAAASAAALNNGDVLLLENLRFHSQEEGNDPVFSKALAAMGDVYVNDAFGTAHRAHASTEGVTKFISKCAAGYLMKKELDFLGNSVSSPARPFLAVIGGAKISGKIDVIEALLPKVDKIIVGGGMAYTFFKAMGHETGRSLVEPDRVALAGELIKKAGQKLLLPVDCQVTDFLDFKARRMGPLTPVAAAAIPADREAVDVGPRSCELFAAQIASAKTVLWNGPMGIFEIEAAARGTAAVAQALARATERGAITIVGGGDSASAIAKMGLNGSVTHVSTGGGASLEFLEGKTLPGVAALTEK